MCPSHLTGNAKKAFSEALKNWHNTRIALRKSNLACQPTKTDFQVTNEKKGNLQVKGKVSNTKVVPQTCSNEGKKKVNPQVQQQVIKYDSHPVYQTYLTARKAMRAELKERNVQFYQLPANIRDTYAKAHTNFKKMKKEHEGSKTECPMKGTKQGSPPVHGPVTES